MNIRDTRTHFFDKFYYPYAPYTMKSFAMLKDSLFCQDSLTIQIIYEKRVFAVTIFLPSNIDVFVLPDEFEARTEAYKVFQKSNCSEMEFIPFFEIQPKVLYQRNDIVTPLIKIEDIELNDSFYLYNRVLYSSKFPVPFSLILDINQFYLVNCLGFHKESLYSKFKCAEFIYTHIYEIFLNFLYSRYVYDSHNNLVRHWIRKDSSGLFFISSPKDDGSSLFDNVKKAYTYTNSFNSKRMLDSFWISTALLERLNFQSIDDSFYLDTVYFSFSHAGTRFSMAKALELDGDFNTPQIYQYRVNGLPCYTPDTSAYQDFGFYRAINYTPFSAVEEYYLPDSFVYSNIRFIIEASNSPLDEVITRNGIYSSMFEIFNFSSDTVLLYDHYFIRDFLNFWHFDDDSIYSLCFPLKRYYPIIKRSYDGYCSYFYDNSNYLDTIFWDGESLFSKLKVWYLHQYKYDGKLYEYLSSDKYMPGTIPVHVNNYLIKVQHSINELKDSLNFSDPLLKKYCFERIPFFSTYLYAYAHMEPYPIYFSRNHFFGSALFNLRLLQTLFSKMDSTIIFPLGVIDTRELFIHCYASVQGDYYEGIPEECDIVFRGHMFDSNDFIIDKRILKEHMNRLPELVQWISHNYSDFNSFLDNSFPDLFSNNLFNGNFPFSIYSSTPLPAKYAIKERYWDIPVHKR